MEKVEFPKRQVEQRSESMQKNFMDIAGKIEIRLAQTDDLTGCATMDKLLEREMIKRKIELGEIFIAEREGKIIGYLRVEYLWSRIPYIALILVQDEYRHQGVGKALLESLQAFLRGRGYRLLLSSSQADEPESQRWHRATGFEECGILTGINEKGIGEIFFRKQLN